MTRIKITPEQIRQVASEFKGASNQSQEMVSRLSSTINGISPDWEGMTKERFYNEFQQWQQSMRQFVELLQNIGQQMDAIATRFEQTDRA